MSASPSFLDLPYRARLKIYKHFGLTRDCPIQLGNETEEFKMPRAPCRRSLLIQRPLDLPLRGAVQRFEGCSCPRIPTNLLLVSKVVSDEALAVLIGRNSFILRARSGSDLQILETMKHSSLAAMTSLFLRLSPWPCRCGDEHV